MLAIPYILGDGKVVTIRFRCLEEHEHKGHGKYMSLPEDPPRVYNVGVVALADDEIHVSEGEFDAMVLNQIGLPTIGLPGASMWQPRFRRLLAGFSRVWVWGDPDEAGAGLVTRIDKALRTSRGVRLTEGDVNETFLKEGARGLLKLIEEDKSA